MLTEAFVLAAMYGIRLEDLDQRARVAARTAPRRERVDRRLTAEDGKR